LSFQQLVVPVLGISLTIWLVVRRGLWQTVVSAIQSKPELKSRYSHPVTEPEPWPQFESSSVQTPQPAVKESPIPSQTATVTPTVPVKKSTPVVVKRGWTPVVYTIKVPKDTEWRPEMAVALVREFVSHGNLALRIASVDHEIQWQVLDMGKTPL